MIIKVDTRETSLFQQMLTLISTVPSFQNILVKYETLPIGDVIINDSIEDKIIIERKSINDLASSIKDGRYEEQSYRLNGLNHHNHNIIYLIEGDVNKPNHFKSKSMNPSEKLTLYSAMFSLNYFKGFSVFRSFNMEESATIICNMAYKIEKEQKEQKKKPYYVNTPIPINTPMPIESITNDDVNPIIDEVPTTSPTTSTTITTNEVILNDLNSNTHDVQTTDEAKYSEKDYVGVIKKVKKENITPDNIGEIMLCQIPGISSVTAIAIMEQYKSIPNLIKELEINADIIKDFSYTNAKGQVRKINKTTITNIVKFLLKK